MPLLLPASLLMPPAARLTLSPFHFDSYIECLRVAVSCIWRQVAPLVPLASFFARTSDLKSG
jgi:hypothetical protein